MPKLSLKIAREIRTAWKQGNKPEQLGKRYGVSVTTITAVVKGDIWKEPSSAQVFNSRETSPPNQRRG